MLWLLVVNLCEEEFVVVEIELEFWVDEFVGSGLENEFSYKGEFLFLEDIFINSEVRFFFGDIDEFEIKLNLNEENEVLMSEVELKRVLM